MGSSTSGGIGAVREYFATRGRGHGKMGPRIQAPVRVGLGSWCPSILPRGPGVGAAGKIPRRGMGGPAG
jgi:hypothetical protein